MKDNLIVKNVTKKYDGFLLDNVSFSIPQGCIVGLIGENGAGKTTIMKSILNLISIDSGEISVLGKTNKNINVEQKKLIGTVFSDKNYPDELSPMELEKVLSNVYPQWDSIMYHSLLNKLTLPITKKLADYSSGMKTKLAIAAALAHSPQILLLDEPTAGLDPVARVQILDLFIEYIENEQNSIFLSSHITADLERIADYIIFIQNGKIIFSCAKEELLNTTSILRISKSNFNNIDKNLIIAYLENDYSVSALLDSTSKDIVGNGVYDKPTLDEIMSIYSLGTVTRRFKL